MFGELKFPSAKAASSIKGGPVATVTTTAIQGCVQYRVTVSELVAALCGGRPAIQSPLKCTLIFCFIHGTRERLQPAGFKFSGWPL